MKMIGISPRFPAIRSWQLEAAQVRQAHIEHEATGGTGLGRARNSSGGSEHLHVPARPRRSATPGFPHGGIIVDDEDDRPGTQQARLGLMRNGVGPSSCQSPVACHMGCESYGSVGIWGITDSYSCAYGKGVVTLSRNMSTFFIALVEDDESVLEALESLMNTRVTRCCCIPRRKIFSTTAACRRSIAWSPISACPASVEIELLRTAAGPRSGSASHRDHRLQRAGAAAAQQRKPGRVRCSSNLSTMPSCSTPSKRNADDLRGCRAAFRTFSPDRQRWWPPSFS